MKREETLILATAGTVAGILLIVLIVLLVRYLLAKRTSEETMQQFQNTALPRGYRNNNPLNIRISSERWLGKVSPNTDGSFEQFSAMEYGYRAAIKTLQTYIRKHHCDTIEKIITRWAPPSENNTQAYIANVANRAGLSPTETITPTNHNQLTAIVYAMAISENGFTPQPDRQAIETAWTML